MQLTLYPDGTWQVSKIAAHTLLETSETNDPRSWGQCKMCTKPFLPMGCLINYLGPKDLTAAPLLQDSLCGPAGQQQQVL